MRVFDALPWYIDVQELKHIFNEIDTDSSGLIDFDEFVSGVLKFLLEKTPNGSER